MHLMPASIHGYFYFKWSPGQPTHNIASTEKMFFFKLFTAINQKHICSCSAVQTKMHIPICTYKLYTANLVAKRKQARAPDN